MPLNLSAKIRKKRQEFIATGKMCPLVILETEGISPKCVYQNWSICTFSWSINACTILMSKIEFICPQCNNVYFGEEIGSIFLPFDTTAKILELNPHLKKLCFDCEHQTLAI